MTAAATTERQAAVEQIDSMIQEIEIAMLTTQAESGLLRSRPMISVTRRFDGDLWFFSHADDERMRDIKAHPRVGVVYSSPEHKNFISMCGDASLVTDRRKFESLWKEELRDWFPDGVDSQDMVLIQIRVDHAEYWDQHKSSMIQVLRSTLTGHAKESVTHEEVTWPSAETPGEGSGRAG